MNDKDQSLSKRLTKYGMLAAAITGASDTNAAIIYTDEAPDFAGVIGSQYFLDLNNDGTDDFRIWHNGSSNLYISPLTATNEVLGSGGATFAYPFALTSGAPISSGAGAFFNNGYAGGFQSLNYGSCSFGNWCSVTDRYIGVRFDISGNTHYGWVRLDVNNSGSVWTVKDYAYDNVIGASIPAGASTGGGPGSASLASTITGADIADNSNGLDLQVDFAAATLETTVNEYRIMIVKSAAAPTFDLAAAQAVIPANYVVIAPTGGPTYSQIYNATSLDTDGDLIVIGQPYRVFVMSEADGVIAVTDNLASAASDVTLNTDVDFALTIAGSDIADNGNATDLQVDFTAAAVETGITEYRVMAVKASAAPAFNLASAQALAATAYEVVSPTGGPYSIIFNASTTDADGDAIIVGQPYSIFVLSVADGVLANIDNIANSSSDVTLNTVAPIVTSIIGTDIADNGNGLDLKVDFIPPAVETGILAYRVCIVKASSAASFDLTTAMALTGFSIFPIPATGAPVYTATYNASHLDSDGDPIIENEPYTIFVVSGANMTDANVNSITSSINDVTLINTDDTGIDENVLDAISTFATNGSLNIEIPQELLGTDIEVSIVNLQGQLIRSAKLKDTESKINISSISNGVYFVNFENALGDVRSVKLYF